MISKRNVDPVLIKEAQLSLQKRFSTDVSFSSAEYLSEPERRNVIVRLTLSEPSSALIGTSVILKQSLPLTGDFDSKADSEKAIQEEKRAFSRFARDWAGLEFGSSIPQSVHNIPTFFCGNDEHCFILIEDLGRRHVSLVDSLTMADPVKASSALERYMKALGSFHAASFNHVSQFREILSRIDKEADAPEKEFKDTAADLPKRLSDVLNNEEIALALSSDFKKDFQSEVHHVIEGIFMPGPFSVLTHGDIAPDNVFDHQGDKGLQLIDFEWCSIRNALLDGTFLRMSIPTGWCAKEVPADILKKVENIYREELKKSIPAARIDASYNAAYVQACAFHALQQIAAINHCLEKDPLWDSGPVPENSLWDKNNNFLRPRILSRLQAFIEVATQHDMYPNIRKMASDVLARVQVLWPEAKPLDVYPAFSTVALKATPSSSGLIARSLAVPVVISPPIEGKKEVSAGLSPAAPPASVPIVEVPSPDQSTPASAASNRPAKGK